MNPWSTPGEQRDRAGEREDRDLRPGRQAENRQAERYCTNACPRAQDRPIDKPMRMTVLVVAVTVANVVVLMLMTGVARLFLVSAFFVGDRQMAHGGHGSCAATKPS